MCCDRSSNAVWSTTLLTTNFTCLSLAQFGGTALIAASSHGHTAAVQALIGAGADLNLPSNDGWTALASASCRGHVTTIQVLIGAGADLNLQDKAGWTALMRASLWGHISAVQALLEAGADRSIRDKVSALNPGSLT
jgi:ankyrin repeat protein